MIYNLFVVSACSVLAYSFPELWFKVSPNSISSLSEFVTQFSFLNNNDGKNVPLIDPSSMISINYLLTTKCLLKHESEKLKRRHAFFSKC